jgi:aldose 1-epimerase
MTSIEHFGILPCGREAHIFTLTNENGIRAQVSDFGALLLSVIAPDRNGQAAEITIGRDNLEGWLADTAYLGATVGRFGNRIAHGKFTLDGKEYCLVTNNTPGGIPCHLHGGTVGFDKVLWNHEIIGNGVRFTYFSADGEEGYPGNLTATVTYTLNDQNELIWTAEATTDAATPVNFVNHTYWNLSGDPTQTILDHELLLHADRYLPGTPGLIPTGEIHTVTGTPLDFTTPQLVGTRIDADFPALNDADGYDQCFVLPETPGVRPAARLRHPATGRILEVLTDQPGVQFYSGNFLDGSPGRNGTPLGRRTGLCLETQRFPDSPNQASFPTCILRPGETYLHTLVMKLSAE